ncbi:photosynthetic complex assembly protein 2 [Thiocapsa imhoffii]|uniref:Photosynthetic complex assembly protein 2 n=1 Tax=Thiocapsa imhoffii TaxID=382777 RepID=A0A9X1B7M6_9GAMM|nr:putative photosynthetic complex assembly protein PuhE [Thiocapsa imhoffii]MBK1643413.1 photosynthetic complex assembly protein 2 [Thiocapsa imhoffii]
MLEYALPVFFALALWWFSTGVVLFLDNLPGRTFGWTMLGGAAVLAVAIFAVVVVSPAHTLVSAYIGFSAGILIWGVLEMSYFTGLLTGPRKQPCPANCASWKRFGLAILTSLYHELAVLAMVAFLVLVTWNEPNQVGTWTFVVLWLMRWSAKLNLFLGVPNLNDWLPDHLAYLKTYMPKRSMNLLFPVSVTASTVVVVILVAQALGPGADPFLVVALLLVATLLALGILEHWFLVLPLPDEALWAWALPPRETEIPPNPGPESAAPPDSVAPRRTTREGVVSVVPSRSGDAMLERSLASRKHSSEG